ncbi:ROK family transcriptional regulator [Kribbella sp. NPDC049227]|uniref:ROK family transcriptional regulator n=1 Tax=Kribbella sp. NPDC049227 TaxID=3364113 RepID=UPI00371E1404
MRRVRDEHRAQVLGRLRAHGNLSKAMLARDLGLSVPTISEILADFETEGVVQPVSEGESSGGRRPILYGLRMDRLLAAGVSVDRHHISAVISDLSGQIHGEVSTDCDLEDGQRRFERTLERVVGRLLTTVETPDRVTGLGVAVPTRMQRSRPGMFLPQQAPGWTGLDLQAFLANRFELPVVAENRAHAVAVGEHLFGAGQGATDLLCLVVDEGLGGAVISGGRLFTGGDGAAGAVGRMILDLNDGKGGVTPVKVSEVVGSSAVIRAAVARLRESRRRRLGGVPLSRVDVDVVIDEALSGDPQMAEVLAEVGRGLGAVVAATLCVTDSPLVVLCGSTMRAGDFIVGPLQEVTDRRLPFAPPTIRLGRLGARGGALGAAALVLTDMVGTVGTVGMAGGPVWPAPEAAGSR